MPYLTPDETPAEVVCRSFNVPDYFGWDAILIGALTELTKDYNWELYGSTTVAEAIAVVNGIIAQYDASICVNPEVGCELEDGVFTLRLGLGGHVEQWRDGTWETPDGVYERPPTPVREEETDEDEDYLFLEEQLGKEAALRSIYEAKKLEDEGKTAEAVKSLRSSRDKALVEQDKKRVASEKDNIFAIQKYEELSNREKLSNLQGTLSYISTLQKSSNRDLFAVGKAAAIATATIDGFQAVQKALASAPPPINFALAALVGTATAANVASIAAQKPPAFQDGGIVPGNSFTGDKVPILANSGELILNKAQQNSLASQLGGSPGLIESILNRPIVIQIDGREIARAVKQQFDQGFGFA